MLLQFYGICERPRKSMLEADEPLALYVFNVNMETGVAWPGLSGEHPDLERSRMI